MPEHVAVHEPDRTLQREVQVRYGQDHQQYGSRSRQHRAEPLTAPEPVPEQRGGQRRLALSSSSVLSSAVTGARSW